MVASILPLTADGHRKCTRLRAAPCSFCAKVGTLSGSFAKPLNVAGAAEEEEGES